MPISLRNFLSGFRCASIIPVLLVVFSLCLIVAPFSLQAEVYHVAPHGDDDNLGSEQQPWQTIGKANITLVAGDTVLLHAGVYDQQIRPVNSGADEANRITYRAYGDGYVELTQFDSGGYMEKGVIALGQRHYVTVSGAAEGDASGTRWIRAVPDRFVSAFGNVCGGSHNIVDSVMIGSSNPEFTANRGFGFCINFWPGDYETSYNVLRNSHLIGTSNYDFPYTEDLVTVTKNAHHNLIENNILENCKHTVVYIDDPRAHSNVVRNNVIRNYYHTALSIWIAGGGNLVEGNWLEASGGHPAETINPGNALQFMTSETIVRHNVISKTGATDEVAGSLAGIASATGHNHPAIYNRFYNNTVVKNDAHGIFVGWFDNAVDIGLSSYVNNIVYGTRYDRLPITYWGNPNGARDVWRTNMIGNPNGSNPQPDPNANIMVLPNHGRLTASEGMSVPVGPDDPVFYDILQPDPGFVDYAGDDYHLRQDSALIDAGTHMTTVSGNDAGSGTTLRVEDSRYFQDGQGMQSLGVEADWIAIGSLDNQVQIASINDSTNTITLVASVSRQVGDAVWLVGASDGRRVVHGQAPDIGALEFCAQGEPCAEPWPLIDDSEENYLSSGNVNVSSGCFVSRRSSAVGWLAFALLVLIGLRRRRKNA